jgi:hypothetical protein
MLDALKRYGEKAKVFCACCGRITDTFLVTPYVAKVKCGECGIMIDREFVNLAYKKEEKQNRLTA